MLLYLAGDPVTAFLVAAVFAWLVHSSVAAVLLFTTLAAQGLMPVEAALAMVLGANLGGSLIAFFLTLKSAAIVRRVVWTNLALRGGGAALALVALSRLRPAGSPAGRRAGAAGAAPPPAVQPALLMLCLPSRPR